MKRYPGMTTLRGVLLASALIAAACGGEQSVASKSAAAYREAQAKGTPVGGGHDHGGHGAATTTGGIDHSAHGTGADAHAGMNHGVPAAAATDHSGHASAGSVDHAAMGHGTAATAHAGHGAPARSGAVDHAAMGHGTAAPAHTGHGAPARSGAVDHAAMGHGTGANAHKGQTGTANGHAQHGASPATGGAHGAHGTTPAPTRDQHAGMQHGTQAPAASAHAGHGTQSPAADPHAAHRAAGAPGAPTVAAAPRSNSEMQRVRPAATLSGDAFDAPAPVSVSEAAKAAQGGGHEGHQARGITPGQDRENPPTPMPATRDGSTSGTRGAADHSGHGAAAATVYSCPMHPEVTSDQPGTCPKCGMALVPKK